MNVNLRSFALWAVVVLLLIFAFGIVSQRTTPQKTSVSQPPTGITHNEVDQNKASDMKNQDEAYYYYYGPSLGSQTTNSQDISFSQLLADVDQGRVRDVLIQGPEIHGTFTDGHSFQTYAPSDPNSRTWSCVATMAYGQRKPIPSPSKTRPSRATGLGY